MAQGHEVRADQYGIRTKLLTAELPIKFEIVFEGRITFVVPDATDQVCGIATLTPLDMATSKLLANCDRWNDDGVFSRDLIDLAMMGPKPARMRQAVAKAEQACGQSVLRDLSKAINRLKTRTGLMERCMHVMAMNVPKAVLWQKLHSLEHALP